MNSPLLQAALSHYIAIRDKSLAELDVYLNRPAGVGDHASVTDEVIKLFAQLESADSTIATIRIIIDGNNPTKVPYYAESNPEKVPASDAKIE